MKLTLLTTLCSLGLQGCYTVGVGVTYTEERGRNQSVTTGANLVFQRSTQNKSVVPLQNRNLNENTR